MLIPYLTNFNSKYEFIQKYIYNEEELDQVMLYDKKRKCRDKLISIHNLYIRSFIHNHLYVLTDCYYRK